MGRAWRGQSQPNLRAHNDEVLKLHSLKSLPLEPGDRDVVGELATGETAAASPVAPSGEEKIAAAVRQRVQNLSEERIRNRRMSVSVVGQSGAGKSSLVGALIGRGAPIQGSTAATTNVVTSFCGGDDEHYTAKGVAREPGWLFDKVQQLLTQVHMPKKKYKSQETLRNIFGEELFRELAASQFTVQDDEQLRGYLARTKAQALETAGNFSVGPCMDAKQLEALLHPYVGRTLDPGGRVSQSSCMVLKRVEITGPCESDMRGVTLKDCPGLGDYNVNLLEVAEEELEEGLDKEVKVLVIDITRANSDEANRAMSKFLEPYVRACHRVGEGKFIIVYTKADLLGDDVLKCLDGDGSDEMQEVNKLKVELKDFTARRMGTAAMAAELESVRRRTPEQEAQLETLRRELETWSRLEADCKAQLEVRAREIYFNSLAAKVQNNAAEVAAEVGQVQEVPQIPVFCVTKAEAEAEAAAGGGGGARQARTGLAKLRRYLKEYKKQRESYAELQTFLHLCELLPNTYNDLRSMFMKTQEGVEATLQDFDKKASEGMERALHEACQRWMQEDAEHVFKDLNDALTAAVTKGLAAQSGDADDDDDEDEGGSGEEDWLACIRQQDWLSSIRLDYLRRLPKQPPTIRATIMLRLLPLVMPLLRHLHGCWAEKMVLPLPTALKNGCQGKVGPGAVVFTALSGQVDRVLKEYGKDYPLRPGVVNSINLSVRGAFSQAHVNLDLSGQLQKMLSNAGREAVAHAVRDWLVAAVVEANSEFPAGQGRREKYVAFLVDRLRKTCATMVEDAAVKLRAEVPKVRAWLELKLLGRRGGAAGASTSVSAGAGGDAGASTSGAGAGTSASAGAGGDAGASTSGAGAGTGASAGAGGDAGASTSGADAGTGVGVGAGGDAGTSTSGAAAGMGAQAGDGTNLVREVCVRLEGLFTSMHPEKVGTSGWCRGAIAELQRFSDRMYHVYTACIKPYLVDPEQQQQAQGQAQEQGQEQGPVAAITEGANPSYRAASPAEIMLKLINGRRDEVKAVCKALEQMAQEVAPALGRDAAAVAGAAGGAAGPAGPAAGGDGAMPQDVPAGFVVGSGGDGGGAAGSPEPAVSHGYGTRFKRKDGSGPVTPSKRRAP